MSRPLGCPHCRAEFSFDDWARARACPSCRRRLSFFEASEAAPPVRREATAAVGHEAALAPGTPDGAADVAALEAAPAGDDWTWGDGGGLTTDVVAPLVPATSLVPAAPLVPAVPLTAAPPAAPPLTGASLMPAAPLTAAPIVEAALPATTAPATSPVAPLPGASLPVVAPASIGVVQRRVLTIGDKPLQWSRGWAIVLVIWAVVAVGLVATRVAMGPVAVMTPAERAAVSAVQAIKLPTGAATETVLRYSATHDLTLEGHVAAIPPGGTQMWYAFDRPWEHKTYVYTTLPGTSMIGKNVVLSWTVEGSDASADGTTRAALTKAAQTMAHPPSSTSVPAVPGIIPSIPPGY